MNRVNTDYVMLALLVALGLVVVWKLATMEPDKVSFVVTPIGLAHGSCSLGLLIGRDDNNRLNKSGDPITCSGYVSMTKKEYEEYCKNEWRGCDE